MIPRMLIALFLLTATAVAQMEPDEIWRQVSPDEVLKPSPHSAAGFFVVVVFDRQGRIWITWLERSRTPIDRDTRRVRSGGQR